MNAPARTQVLEILAPAGSLEAFAAALSSGADVVYLGLSEGWNARARSTAFDRANLRELVLRAHRAGAKLYLTLNTLVFESELPALEALLRDVVQAGVDALIVQDPAVAFVSQRLCPELHVHASTQMTISSAEGARFAATLGVRRVVLPRELSAREVARFVEQSPMQAEVFIHGALCMSWSGQCLTSEALSGRSANRGQCSQACRMPYELVVDGALRPLGDLKYLLSPQDLAGAPALPELMQAGVHAVKIEGRYKNAAYVTTSVDAVRNYRDAVVQGTEASAKPQLDADVRRTQLTFSRGASLGFLNGDDHQRLVIGRSPKHRGVLLGTVLDVRGRRVRVALDGAFTDADALRPGLGVMFDVGDPEDDDAPGGPIFEVQRVPGAAAHVEFAFGTPGPDLGRVPHGAQLYLTGDPELAREAARRAKQQPEGRIGLAITVSGNVDLPLHVHALAHFAGRTLHATAASAMPLQTARAGGLDEALLRDKLCAFGGTAFRGEVLDVHALAPGLHVAVSELKRLRRELVSSLDAQLDENPLRLRDSVDCVADLRGELGHDLPPMEQPPQLVPLCRTLQQLQAVIDRGVRAGDEVELDFMELVGLSQAVALARDAGVRLTLATVRVQKPGEEGYDRRIAALAPDAVLVRHWGALMHFAEAGEKPTNTALHGDFSLNVTNSLTACHLLRLGLTTLTASHDLDKDQLLALLDHTPRGRVAVTLHHHIATFHNSHCVYAHLLSDGSDYRTCGRPCESHRVALRDFAGNDHPVIVDVSCRNTVFNAVAQSAAPLLPVLLERGVRRFRVEFVWETGEQVTRTLDAYSDLLAGKLSAQAALRSVGVHEQYGVTTLRR